MSKICAWSPRQESNLYLALRRHLFYPLNYGEDGTGMRRRGQSIAKTPLNARPAQRPIAASELDYCEFGLRDVAKRAAPRIGDIREPRAGGNPLVGQAFFLVIDPPANHADPTLELGDFAHGFQPSIHRQKPQTLARHRQVHIGRIAAPAI